jgi:histidinol-phosphate aminotransferase
VLPSGANFIFTKHSTIDGATLAARLREQNIIVRHFKSPERIAPYLRISVGTDLESQALIQAIASII